MRMHVIQSINRAKRKISLKIAERIATTIRRHSLPAATLALALAILAPQRSSRRWSMSTPPSATSAFCLCRRAPPCTCPTAWFASIPMRADAMDDQIKSFPLTISSHRMQELFSIMPGDSRRPPPTIRRRPRRITTPCASTIPSSRQSSRPPNAAATSVSLSPGQASVVLANRLAGDLRMRGQRSCRRRKLRRHEGLCLRRIQFARHVEIRRLQRREVELTATSTRHEVSGVSLRHFLHQHGTGKEKSAPRNSAWGFATSKGRGAARAGTKRSVRSRSKAALKRNAESSTPRSIAASNAWSTSPKTAAITAHSIIRSIRTRVRSMSTTGFGIPSAHWNRCRRCSIPRWKPTRSSPMSACISNPASCPRSPSSAGNYACMNGNHAAPWFADAWFKGVQQLRSADRL